MKSICEHESTVVFLRRGSLTRWGRPVVKICHLPALDTRVADAAGNLNGGGYGNVPP